MAKTKVIIDCDPGTDDAQAILIALASQEIDVVAITTVFGNAGIDDTTRNVVRLLKYFHKLDIPVYKGCSSSLLFDNGSSHDAYHGQDGFGDITFEGVDPVDVNCIQQERAATAICRLVSQQPGSITLLAVGPLTNIAVALMLDPQLGSKLKDCVIMGGNYLGRGNVTPSSEFNWFMDPEAAHSVLCGLNIIPTLVPLDTCLEASFSWEWYDNASRSPTRAAQFVKAIDSFTVNNLRRRKISKYHAWDQLAMAIIVDPNIIVEAQKVYGVVELHGNLTRGQLVVDWSNKLEKTHNINIVTSVNQTLYESVASTAFR